ncbi:hypothetical protein ACFP51_33795 [Streptomyces pratens]|uniref:Uncharacterized protein n=1 Tax=Streptomyces pratens TaxID=887456 RepID=A0ABW1M6V7_9ACTN
MNHRSNWTGMDNTWNEGRETERPCPHRRGQWPEMDEYVVCEGDGTGVVGG